MIYDRVEVLAYRDVAASVEDVAPEMGGKPEERIEQREKRHLVVLSPFVIIRITLT